MMDIPNVYYSLFLLRVMSPILLRLRVTTGALPHSSLSRLPRSDRHVVSSERQPAIACVLCVGITSVRL